MDLIHSYQEDNSNKNLLYLAKPVYGGWVTFTAICLINTMSYIQNSREK